MNEVNKTLFIPLYGKARISKMGIILNDKDAESIWGSCGFKIKGKSKSKWLAYNMAMRARIFDDWTRNELSLNPDALVLHLGCGLDSRYNRIQSPAVKWIDIDMDEVITVRKSFYKETQNYSMLGMNLKDSEKLLKLPDATNVIVIMEGVSMYLKNEELLKIMHILNEKYYHVHLLFLALV